jgi:hypothetical protein
VPGAGVCSRRAASVAELARDVGERRVAQLGRQQQQVAERRRVDAGAGASRPRVRVRGVAATLATQEDVAERGRGSAWRSGARGQTSARLARLGGVAELAASSSISGQPAARSSPS